MLTILLLVSHVLCATATSPELAGSRAFLSANLPQYIPKEAGKRLINAQAAKFYKKFEDEACYVGDFMTKIDELETFHYTEQTCTKAVLKTILDFALGKDYARKMRDSMGRVESGLLRGNYLWLGNYFECKGASGEGITGQPCNAIISDQPNSTEGLYLGICVPDVCTAEELTGFFQSIFTSSNETFVTVTCPPKYKIEASDIVAIVICSLLGGLVICCTAFEVVLTKREKKRGQNRVNSTGSNLSASSTLGISFSIIKNTRILLDTKRKEGNLDFLDGMRFLSMAWIILGHSFSSMMAGLDNIYDLGEYFLNHGSLMAISNATFSVDTFFFLSGLLVAYVGLRQMDKTGGKLNVPLMYLSRYLRITPAMAVVMLIAASLYEQMGEGPLYYSNVEQYAKEPCVKYWWTNLLYINNLYPGNTEEQCIGWVWYLANDMQFYLLSPIFLFLFYRKPKVAYGVIAAVTLISMGITGFISAYFNRTNDIIIFSSIFHSLLGTNVNANATSPPLSPASYWNDIYTKPWCRIGVYLIGMTTGYILHVTKRNIKMNKIFVIGMWIVVIAVELTVIYGFCGPTYYNYIPSQAALSFYDAVSRPVWGLGLAWVTIACATGYGGPINKFLSWKVFAPLSRLTYCAYLIHVPFIYFMYLSREYEMHFQICIFIYYYLAALTFSYALAYVLSMIVEAPMADIQKAIFPKFKSAKPSPEQNVVVIENVMTEKGTDSSKKSQISDEAENEEIKIIPSNFTESDRL